MRVRGWVAWFVSLSLLFALVMPGSAADSGKAAVPDQAIDSLGDANSNGLQDKLESLIQAGKPGTKFDVIVQFTGPANAIAYAAAESMTGPLAYRANWDAALQGFATSLTGPQIKALSRSPAVARIDADLEVQALINTATSTTGVNKARTDFSLDGDRDGNSTSYSKTDVVVAVLDTGIDAKHIDLDGGKVIGWWDEVNRKTAAYDDHGHGSHVSGIIAGTGEGNSANKGVAPGVALVGIKVLNRRGSGTTTGIINGINWMINNKATYGIRVGNMSLGSSGCSDGTDSLSVAVNNAVANEIIMAVAAGNAGPQKCTIGSPAAAANAITVGASYDIGELGLALAEFSSRGPTSDGRVKPDIVTPGRNINSVKANSTNGYTIMSGTSMATPFMAGVVALMLDANYSLTDSGVKSILYGSANYEERGPTGKDVDYGYGLNLAYNSVKAAGSYSGSFDDGQDYSTVVSSLSGTGAYEDYNISVTSTSMPISITLIMTNWSSSANPDFDLYLFNPSGTQVATAEGVTRQELIRYSPTVTGTWKIRVKSYTGSGDFFFDASYQ